MRNYCKLLKVITVEIHLTKISLIDCETASKSREFCAQDVKWNFQALGWQCNSASWFCSWNGQGLSKLLLWADQSLNGAMCLLMDSLNLSNVLLSFSISWPYLRDSPVKAAVVCSHFNTLPVRVHRGFLEKSRWRQVKPTFKLSLLGICFWRLEKFSWRELTHTWKIL